MQSNLPFHLARATRQRIAATTALVIIALVHLTGALSWTGLTASQQITALILVIAATLWISEWVPLFVVSFLILAMELVWLIPAMEQEGIESSATQFMSPFFSNIILLFLGGFVLSSLMQRYRLDVRFAHFILIRTHGNPDITLLGIILSCAFLSMWMSNTATTAMMLTMILPLVKRLPADAPFRVALVLAIPFACNLGGIGTPIGTPPNAIALSYLNDIGIGPSFVQWMAFTIPFLIVFLVLLWRLLLKLYPAKGITLALPDAPTDPLNYKQWLTLTIFLITVVGWLLSDLIGLKTGTVALFPIIVAFWLGLLDQHDFRSLPWDVLFMVAGGLALGVALSESGLGSRIVGMLPGDLAYQVLLVLAVALTGFMSTIMSNTATAGLVIPLLLSLPLDLDNALVLILAVTMMCSLSMALPVSTPPNAIAFSSGALHTKDLMKTGLLISILGLLVVTTLGPVFWFLLV